MNRQNYRAQAERSGDWWSITMPDLPGVFSQAKCLDQVAISAREAIGLYLETEEDDFEVHVEVTPPENSIERLEALHQAVAVAMEASDVATRLRREAAEALRAEGLPLRDVGELLGVSHQRVSQILAGHGS